jgi:hypothetical protein
MVIPPHLEHRVCRTKLSGWCSSFQKLDKIRREWQGSEIDVIYENSRPIVVVVFESPEDCLAFTLKYGKEYV